MSRLLSARSSLTTALAFLTLALVCSSASAQTPSAPEVFVGFSALRDLGTDDVPATTYGRGWTAAVGVPLPWWQLQAVAEGGANHRANLVGETQRLSAVLGGVRRQLLGASRLVVFVHALAGLEWFSEPGFSESGPALQPGVGVDVAITSRLGARAQADLRLSSQNGDRFTAARIAFGVVVR